MDCVTIVMNDSYKNERSYICHVVFKEFLGVNFLLKFTNDKNGYYEIIYNNNSTRLPDKLFSYPEHEWLKKSSLPASPLRHISHSGGYFSQTIPVIYGAEPKETIHGPDDIDILGSIFFSLTRYEEVNSPHKDEFGRFDHKASLFFKENLLRRPIVNEYLEIMKSLLRKVAPGITFKKHEYTLSLSHDVDVPITLHLPLGDFLKKSAGDLYFRRSPELLIRRLFGKVIHLYNGSFGFDPNNTFAFLVASEENAGVRSVFNFIPVQGSLPHDSHYDLNHPLIKSLFLYLSEREFEIGFHPSYNSFANLRQTEEEMNLLNESLAKLNLGRVKKGRQHYLRWTNPTSWQIWNAIGMQEDGSVGYGMQNGFRAGCAFKYSVFDLLARKHLDLIEEPLILMDVNSDVNGNPESILDEVDYFTKVCRFFGGNLSLLYHNNYVLSKRQKNIYLELLKIAR